MKSLIITLSLLFGLSLAAYNRQAAVNYAYQYVHSPNHQCGSGTWSCTPYCYCGGERCGYSSVGGDCANFVSQCLIAAGHPKLTEGECRGKQYCGAEVGAWELSQCLVHNYGWKGTCGYHQTPPSNIAVGDVLVYFSGKGCSGKAHATIVTKIDNGIPKISCHTYEKKDEPYTYLADSKPYYYWIHHP